MAVIGQRRDFLAANHGLRVARPGFVLLVRSNIRSHAGANQVEQQQEETAGLGTTGLETVGLGRRYGITVTKRIGNAVVRNRMKRRFRELLRDVLPQEGLPDHDHILIGREGGVERDFATMRVELSAALKKLRDGKGDPPRHRGPSRGANRSKRTNRR